jgi:D-3-phosphoglycerate dehydrogenase / 2-oxoglutarate reductase
LNQLQIVIAEPDGFPEESSALLRSEGQVVLCGPDRTDLLSGISNADVLWIRLRHRIDAAVMAAAPGLKIIVTPTTGLNHIDLAEAGRRGIQVLSLRGKTEFLKNIRATAEHTISLMLALLRHIPSAASDVTAGFWRRDQFQGTELYGKTVGLFGYGRLGRIVAKYLSAFDVRVLVTDPLEPLGRIDTAIESVPAAQVLHQSDVISLHVDLREDTRGFFDAAMFKAMKRGAYFINTSRGELIAEEALLERLRSGDLAGAALDVLADEDSSGMAGHPLIQYAQRHSNLIITPHIGGCTAESMRKTEHFLALELCAILRGQICREALASS